MTAMADSDRKSLMRSLGEFVGHVVKGIRTDPAKPGANGDGDSTVIRETTEEAQQGNVILRRTTIEEVEVKSGGPEIPPDPTRPDPTRPADGANPPRA